MGVNTYNLRVQLCLVILCLGEYLSVPSFVYVISARTYMADVENYGGMRFVVGYR